MDFQLQNDPARPSPRTFDTTGKGRQSKMFSGMDCLPGQQELPGMEDIDSRHSATSLLGLPVDARFRFPGSDVVYTYRGNGWYGKPYSGGPWHSEEDTEVIRV